MSDDSSSSPSKPDDRAARLAEQLRANLRRRKTQARAIAAKSDLPKSGSNG